MRAVIKNCDCTTIQLNWQKTVTFTFTKLGLLVNKIVLLGSKMDSSSGKTLFLLVQCMANRPR